MIRLPAIFAAIAAAAPTPTATGDDGGRWPSFRGPHASGTRDGMDLPVAFDGQTGEGVRYKVAIPGLAHSSPVVWDGRIYLTTAVSSEPGATFQPGQYGDGDASDDRSVHEWRVYCLDLETGEVLWQRTAKRGRPQDKRHKKATYANATPATDGERVVAMFGSEGLFAYSTDGAPLWQKELGRIDAGAYNAPSYEWGPASSPVIYDGKVFVQCDQQEGSFITAVDVETGRTLWRTPRDELPSWGTPTIYPGGERAELVTNGSNFIRGYDPDTGEELWRLGGSSKITAPTPIYGGGLIVVSSGRAPERPIFAIRPGASGDITPDPGETSGRSVAWSKTKRGGYMPTPLIYRGNLYSLNNGGLLACFDLATGKEHFYERLPHRGKGFSASPVACDGTIYLAGEDGTVLALRAGDSLEVTATHQIGEPLMATPALASGTMLLRGQHHLFAVGNRGPRDEPTPKRP